MCHQVWDPLLRLQSLSPNLIIFQFLSPDLIISHQSPFRFLGREGLPWETEERERRDREGGSTSKYVRLDTDFPEPGL